MSPQGDYWHDKERGIVWCIIPKCASTSLDVSLESHDRIHRDEALALHLPAVVFVRHPWQRLMSALKHPLHTHPDPVQRLVQHCEVKVADMNIHVRPMWTFVEGFDLAYIGNIEAMASGWKRIGEMFGALPELVHENQSGARSWAKLDYDWTRLLPAYEKDFDLYGRVG